MKVKENVIQDNPANWPVALIGKTIMREGKAYKVTRIVIPHGEQVTVALCEWGNGSKHESK